MKRNPQSEPFKTRPEDAESIEALCQATWKEIYRFVYFKVQNGEEARDITQETYVRAIPYMKEKRIESDNAVRFLKTVALNIIRDSWRKAKQRRQNVSLDKINPHDVAIPDTTALSIERQLLKEALNQLNHEQRMVVELRIIKGYSVAETAQIMQKKEVTIRVMQFRALGRLAEYLKNNG